MTPIRIYADRVAVTAALNESETARLIREALWGGSRKRAGEGHSGDSLLALPPAARSRLSALR